MENLGAKQFGHLLGNAAILMGEVARNPSVVHPVAVTGGEASNTASTATWVDNWLWLIVFGGEVCLVLLLTFFFWLYLRAWVAKKINDNQNGAYNKVNDQGPETEIPAQNL
jgi:hypothetical protein